MELNSLSSHMENLPQKWAQEQNLKLQKTLQTDLLESISKAAHGKSLALHLKSLDSTPLQLAKVAPLADHPRLFLSFVIGSLATTAAAVAFILILVTIQGPKTTFENLTATGFRVLSNPKEIDHALHQEKIDARILLIKGNNSFLHSLLHVMSVRREKVCVISCDSSKEEGLFNFLESGHPLSIESDTLKAGFSLMEEPLLLSKKFQTLLKDLKNEYSQIVLHTHSPLTTLKGKILSEHADQIVAKITHEKLQDLAPFMAKGYFCPPTSHEPHEMKEIIAFIQEKKQTALRTLEPKLHALMAVIKNRVGQRLSQKKK